MKKVLSFLFLVFLVAACGGSASRKGGGVSLSGAGATFPVPFYTIVFKEFAKATGIDVTYGGIGSGGGVRSLMDRTVDFGATDVFLSDKEMAEMPSGVVHIPTVMGAVVLAYNLKEVKELRLDAALISAIFRGEVKNWDDPAIRALNPGVVFPDKGITPVYRSDGSGTTAVFSEYMVKADAAWKEAIGEGKSLRFPAGVAAKGNPGVAGIVAETDGAIGYIGSEYAMALNIPSASLRNSSGNFVKAGTRNITASAKTDIPGDTRVSITNAPDPEAYPISTFTWIITYKDQGYSEKSKANAAALVALLRYMTGPEGQSLAVKTYYAPLPASVQEQAREIIKKL